MTGLDSVQLKEVIVHKIGNPTRGEDIKLSQNPLTVKDTGVKGLLTKVFSIFIQRERALSFYTYKRHKL